MLISELCASGSTTPSTIPLGTPHMANPGKMRYSYLQQTPSPALPNDQFEHPVSPFNGSASSIDMHPGEGTWDQARVLPSPVKQTGNNGYYFPNSRQPLPLQSSRNTLLNQPRSTAHMAIDQYPYSGIPSLRSQFGRESHEARHAKDGVPEQPIFQNQAQGRPQEWEEVAGHFLASSVPQKRPKSESDDDETIIQDDSCDRKPRFAKKGATCPTLYEFACPYFKRNRQKFCQQRSCRTSGWPSVHRVKEHLYRHHMHYVCERCSCTFKQLEQLRQHLRQEIACPVSSRRAAEDTGFDQELEKKLRSRKKIDGQTEPDKWVHMFRMLFPSFEDKDTPSPYVDYSLRDESMPSTVLSTRQFQSSPQQEYYTDVDTRAMVAMAAAAEQRLLEGEQAARCRREDENAASKMRSAVVAKPFSENLTRDGERKCDRDREQDQDSSSPASIITSEMFAEVQSLAPQVSKRVIRKFLQQQLQAVLANLPSSPASSTQGAED